MTEKCEFCGYPLANYQDQVEHSSLHHPNVDPERTNSSVSPAQTENRNESNTELTQKRTNGSVSPAQMDTTEYPDISASSISDTLLESECDHPWHRYRIMHDPSHCPKCGEKL